jgi:LCP family protein required for cell wall assembly
VLGRIGKALVVVLSILVFGTSAFAWATVSHLNGSLTTADVIGGGGFDGAQDILLVGTDARTDAQGHPLPKQLRHALHIGADTGELDTDTLILVHIPQNGKRARAFSIPRDAYVQIPGYGKHKINSAFQRAARTTRGKLKRQGVTDQARLTTESNKAGARELIRTVQGLTGVTIDHYARVNFLGFYRISQAIGGVPVCLKHAVNDKRYSGAVFPAGEQVIKGKKALEFVRQRHNIPGGSTDLQRERRQQAFLASMAHKVLSAGVLTHPGKLSALMDAVQKSMVIDQGWDLTNFAEQMAGLSSGNIKFVTIPVENINMHTQSDGDAVEVDPQTVQAFVAGRKSGHRAASRRSTSPDPKQAGRAARATNRTVTVNVRNTTNVAGLAGSVANALTSKGFTRGEVANASPRRATVIHYPDGERQAAERVRRTIGGDASIRPDADVPAGGVTVYLGSTYQGPGSPNGSGTSSSGEQGGTSGSPAPAKPPKPAITADGVPCVN